MVQVEVHAPMEPPQPEAYITLKDPDESFNEIGHHSTPKDPISGESGVSKPFEQNGNHNSCIGLDNIKQPEVAIKAT